MRDNVIVIHSNPEENKFETISDFKMCMYQGGEVQFEWNNKDYYITHPDGLICIYEPYKEETAKEYKTIEETLEHIIDGQKLREIITKVTVWERNV